MRSWIIAAALTLLPAQSQAVTYTLDKVTTTGNVHLNSGDNRIVKTTPIVGITASNELRVIHVDEDGNLFPLSDILDTVATAAKQDELYALIQQTNSKLDTANSSLSTANARIGDLTETAPASDTAASGLNGRLQRVAQRLTLLDADLNSQFSITQSKQDSALSEAQSFHSDNNARIGATNESAPASDIATSGLNGRLQRIAQRLTSVFTAQSDGTQRTKLTDGTNNVDVQQASSDGALASLWGLLVNARNRLFNGTSWDSWRSASVGSDIARTGVGAVSPYGEYNLSDQLRTTGTLGFFQQTRKGDAWVSLRDPESGLTSRIDGLQSLKVAETTRLLGGNAVGSTINTNIWSTSTTGSGTATSGSGLFSLTTGTTANSTAALQSIDVAALHSGTVNNVALGIRVTDTGTANNERRWGAWTTSNGIFYKLAGSTLSVCRMQTGVESCVDQGSWNGNNSFTLDTNFHNYDIDYSNGSARFYIDRKLMHVISVTTSALADSTSFPIRISNASVSGGTTSAVIQMRGSIIQRYGRPVGRPRPFFTTANANTTLKSEPGTVHTLCVTRNGGIGGANVTLYDNTAASGPVIISVTFGGNDTNCFPLNVDFNTGLTVANGSTNLETFVSWE